MTEQLALFDLSEGRRRRDDGMALVLANDPEAWHAEVDRAIAELAASGRIFTAEDVRAIVVVEPHHPNAWGAAINRARVRGVIEPAGYVQATRAARHANRNTAWKGAR